MPSAEERRCFFELADRLARASDLEEQSRLKEELARMTFGAAEPATEDGAICDES